MAGREGGDFWWKILLVWRSVLKGGMEKLCLDGTKVRMALGEGGREAEQGTIR